MLKSWSSNNSSTTIPSRTLGTTLLYRTDTPRFLATLCKTRSTVVARRHDSWREDIAPRYRRILCILESSPCKGYAWLRSLLSTTISNCGEPTSAMPILRVGRRNWCASLLVPSSPHMVWKGIHSLSRRPSTDFGAQESVGMRDSRKSSDPWVSAPQDANQISG